MPVIKENKNIKTNTEAEPIKVQNFAQIVGISHNHQFVLERLYVDVVKSFEDWLAFMRTTHCDYLPEHYKNEN